MADDLEVPRCPVVPIVLDGVGADRSKANHAVAIADTPRLGASVPHHPLTGGARSESGDSVTERYAYVTFFVNRSPNEPFPAEGRVPIPSPRVATYDLKPEMNAARG